MFFIIKVYCFHNRIKELREKKGLNQTELGNQCFLSQNSISAIEHELTCPRASVALLIVKALDVSFEECFYFDFLEDTT